MKNDSLWSNAVFENFSLKYYKTSDLTSFTRHLKAHKCVQQQCFSFITLLQRPWPAESVKIVTDLVFYMCMYCWNVHQVRTLVFDSYQRCPVSLKYLNVPEPFSGIWNLCNKGIFSFFILLQLWWPFESKFFQICYLMHMLRYTKWEYWYLTITKGVQCL